MNDEELIEQMAEPILREYGFAFKAVRGCIESIPDDMWTVDDELDGMFCRQVCHLLWAADAYSGGHRTKAATRFGVPAGSYGIKNLERFPGRQEVLAYVDEVETQVAAWVRLRTKQNLTGKKKVHPPMNVVVYTLRHTAVHLAYLMRDMHRRGIRRPDY